VLAVHDRGATASERAAPQRSDPLHFFRRSASPILHALSKARRPQGLLITVHAEHPE
jgi:hypothetical protein